MWKCSTIALKHGAAGLNFPHMLWAVPYLSDSSEMNHPSTLWRAQGVLRRNVRLDFTVGLNWKHRTGMRRAISFQPCRCTSSLRIFSSVMPCKGSRGCDGSVMSQFAKPLPASLQDSLNQHKNVCRGGHVCESCVRKFCARWQAQPLVSPSSAYELPSSDFDFLWPW